MNRLWWTMIVFWVLVWATKPLWAPWLERTLAGLIG